MFEGFTPTAKLVNGKSYSIISDYLGTPLQAIDSEGKLIWERELDIYGRICKETKETANFVPMLYQGQYLDTETELVYNYKRYYSQETGAYISQDPIGLAGGNPTIYGYVKDPNTWVDVFGLTAEVYRLVATQDGNYDLKQYGQPTIKGGAFLKEGDTWKIGETTQFNSKGKQKRYSDAWLQRNNLRYEAIKHSQNKSDKKHFQKIETKEIDDYIKKFGKRPAGNSCRH